MRINITNESNRLFPETIFDSRKALWDGLGSSVAGTQSSEEAIVSAGLDWNVYQDEVYTKEGIKIPGAYANIRDKDNRPLGIVGERYNIVQNSEAFNFTDDLLGEGVEYEQAGSLKGGKVIWLLAKLPDSYKILDDKVEPYLLFSSSHDGSGSIKVAMTPMRIACMNTLNLALKKAQRSWSARHTGNINTKLEQARQTLGFATTYMEELNNFMEGAYKVKLDDDKIINLVDTLIPVEDNITDRKKTNLQEIKMDILFRYENAPDLKDREKTGARFLQAVSDSVNHREPARLTQNYQSNLFYKNSFGNDLLDRASGMILERIVA